jgi:hypothetical protein
MKSFENQISFLVHSSFLFNKLSSILEEEDPESLFKFAANGRRTARVVQLRKRDRVIDRVNKRYEDSLVLLTEVCYFSDFLDIFSLLLEREIERARPLRNDGGTNAARLFAYSSLVDI